MKKLITLTALGTILIASHANAAGFLLREQSIAGMGNAFAGATAGAEDASYAFYNPATIIRQQDQVSFNATAIVGHVKGEGALSTKPLTGEPYAYNPKMNHPVNKIILPSVAAAKALDSRNSIGISLSAPFGLVTDYSPLWAGANHGTLSELSIYNITAMYAHRLTCDLTIGAGLIAQYADATLKNGVLHGGQYLGPQAPLNMLTSNSTMHGTAADLGYIIGGLYEYSADTRFGMAYRSKINQKLDGKISFATNTSVMTMMKAINQDITAKLTTPALWTMGVYHDINAKWSVMAEAQKTYWSTFDDLTIKGHLKPEKPLSVTDENWHNAWFYSIGANYQVNEQWKLRFGLAFDQTPVSDFNRTPRIPDSDRYWFSTGFEYKYNDKLTINAGYSFIHAESSTVNLLGTGNDVERGGLYAKYKGNIHLFGLGAVYNF